MEDLDKLLLKGLLVLVTAPAWYPFLKAVWEEFNSAMADEGGVFGRAPTLRELEQIQRERLGQPDPLIHEPWLTPEQRMAGRKQMRTPAEKTSKSSAASTRAPERARRGGFKS